MAVKTPGGIYLPETAAEPSLGEPELEHLRVLERDYRQAPEGTSEPIRKVYESMAEALIYAQRFRLLLPQLAGYWMGHHATETQRLIGLAMEAYQHAQLHLLKPDGGYAFADANHRLDNINQTILHPISLFAARACDTCPPVDPAHVLEAMRLSIAAIMEVKTAPPRRDGRNYIIQGYTLELSGESADLLELGLRTGETPAESGTPINGVYEKLGIDRRKPETQITARISRLKDKLRDCVKQCPFRIEVGMRRRRLVAEILPKR
jgi:hypothetical protein